MNLPELKAGVYRHKNGDVYLLDGYIRNHETDEVSVAYIPLYTKPEHRGPRKSFTTIERWQKSFSYVGPVL